MPQLLVGDALRATVQKLPNKTAFIFEDQRITFATFEDRVNRLANGLLDNGYKPGDHIAILAFNCIEYYESLFALAKAGMVAIPVNFRFVGPDINYIINHSDAQALIYEAQFCDVIRGIRPEFENVGADRFIVFGGKGDPGDTSYEDLITKSNPADPDIEVDETTIWYIGYTSGTTGRPKGAMRSHRSNILLAANAFYINEEDIILLIMPIFHSNSVWFGLISIYWGASTVIYPSGGFNPREVLKLIEREKVTFSSMVPTMYSLILQVPDKENFDTSSLKRLLCSSAPLMTKTKEQILEFFTSTEIYEGYGATESGAVTQLLPKDQYRTVRSCGRARPFTRIKILDASGKQCGPGKVGELFAVSPGMFDGYYKQPEADAEAFRGEYLSVGDMAMVDEEGYYYIVDRKHDMIITGGENVYPTEIEDILSKHPKILQVAVVGVPHEKWGEAVKAVVVLESDAKVTEDEIIAYSKEHMAGYKCPKSVDFNVSLPVNPMGKILRREIRQKYWEGRDVKI